MKQQPGIKRKLAAILNADVQGYSQLMRQDEEATVSILGRYRELMGALVQNHGGRVVDFPGDNLLAEFPSVVEAVRAAVKIQEALARANEEIQVERRMQFRIGINLGDVLQEGDRIYGNGVNVAARVQELAPAGGICVSESVYEQVEHKLSMNFAYLGKHSVKNIPRPVRVYAVNPVSREAQPRQRKWKLLRTPKVLSRWTAMISFFLMLLIGLGWFLSKNVQRAVQDSAAVLQSDSGSKIATLAVLPFLDLSQEADQEHMGEGIAEDLITALSTIPRLSVVSRSATFRYKGKLPDLKDLGQQLNVKYLLEGSVQKEGERFRVTVQLIDVATGLHIWADRFDIQGTDTFSVKDEVTLRIMKSLQIQIGEREGFSVKPKQTESLEAYLRFLRGRSFAAWFTRDKNIQARRLFQEAVSLDPSFVDAHSAMAHTYLLEWWFGWDRSPQESLELAWISNQEALRLDPERVNACGLQSHLLSLMGKRLEAVQVAAHLLEKNPRSSEALGWMGVALYYDGKIQEGITFLEKALRVGKTPAAWYLHHLGYAYLMSGRSHEAVTVFLKVLDRNEKNPWALVGLVAAKAMVSNIKEAREWASKVFSLHSGLNAELFAYRLPFPVEAQRESFLAALHEVGLE